ncbi:hypothetical protein [Streptomyces sp. OspMP-M43]|uniref:hypothetical protein n=1 Tax=Streptomyces sp. OspMP-M43 TaxID=1839781 RepID=UPI001EFA7479|nr:hypothetical protein [Streptomyces sp. OspMP-M43]
MPLAPTVLRVLAVPRVPAMFAVLRVPAMPLVLAVPGGLLVVRPPITAQQLTFLVEPVADRCGSGRPTACRAAGTMAVNIVGGLATGGRSRLVARTEGVGEPAGSLVQVPADVPR